MAFPAGQDPLELWVLYTVMTLGHEQPPGCRAYGFTDEAAAKAEGERLKAQKPAEAASFEYMVVPLEQPSG